MHDKEYLTVAEAAEYLDVHHETIRRYIYRGKLPARKGAYRIAIRVADLDRLALGEPVVASKANA